MDASCGLGLGMRIWDAYCREGGQRTGGGGQGRRGVACSSVLRCRHSISGEESSR